MQTALTPGYHKTPRDTTFQQGLHHAEPTAPDPSTAEAQEETSPLVHQPSPIVPPPIERAAMDSTPQTKPQTRKRTRSSSPTKKALKQARAKSSAPLSSNGALTKPKRVKTVIQKPACKVPTIQRDASGQPMLPLVNGVYTLHSLGGMPALLGSVSSSQLRFAEVVSMPNYHTERYIYPVGYESSRCVAPYPELPRLMSG